MHYLGFRESSANSCLLGSCVLSQLKNYKDCTVPFPCQCSCSPKQILLSILTYPAHLNTSLPVVHKKRHRNTEQQQYWTLTHHYRCFTAPIETCCWDTSSGVVPFSTMWLEVITFYLDGSSLDTSECPRVYRGLVLTFAMSAWLSQCM